MTEGYTLDPSKRIVITPIANAETQFGPASFDLRLGYDFKVFRESRLPNVLISPIKSLQLVRQEIASSTDTYVVKPKDNFVLHPNQFVLASTLEYIMLPEDIAGILDGRSTWGRFGLQVHSTAGFIDPGYAGNITFELQNFGSVPLSLPPGLRLAQISFWQLSGKSTIPYSKKKVNKYYRSVGTKIGTLKSLR